MTFNVINMEKKYRKRDKAFIGAAIGAVASIAGGLIGGAKKRREAKRQEAIAKRNREYETRVNEANNINEALASNEGTYDEEFADRLMKYGGKKKYKDRKAWGGWGDVIGGVIGGIGTVAEAATETPGIGAAANTIGGAVGSGITNKMQQNASNRQERNLAAPLQQPIGIPNIDPRKGLPTKLPMINKYGGRHMPLVAGSKGVKVRPKRV